MPADLSEAIRLHLEADSTVTDALAGGAAGVWADEAPEDADLPYLAILSPVDDEADYESIDDDGDAPYDDTGEVQVSVFAASSKSLARAIGDLVQKSLNDAALTFDDGELLHIRRVGRHTTLDPDPGPGGVDVWQCALRFKSIVSRTI